MKFVKLTFTVCFLSAVVPVWGFSAAAQNASPPLLHKLVFGIVAHDRGPTSDRHESGVDPNWEIQVTPPSWNIWQWIGSPNPSIGVTPNFNGHTSVFYAGVNYEFNLANEFIENLTQNLTRNLFLGALGC
jgi:hypothetical protein